MILFKLLHHHNEPFKQKAYEKIMRVPFHPIQSKSKNIVIRLNKAVVKSFNFWCPLIFHLPAFH